MRRIAWILMAVLLFIAAFGLYISLRSRGVPYHDDDGAIVGLIVYGTSALLFTLLSPVLLSPPWSWRLWSMGRILGIFIAVFLVSEVLTIFLFVTGAFEYDSASYFSAKARDDAVMVVSGVFGVALGVLEINRQKGRR